MLSPEIGPNCESFSVLNKYYVRGCEYYFPQAREEANECLERSVTSDTTTTSTKVIPGYIPLQSSTYSTPISTSLRL